MSNSRKTVENVKLVPKAAKTQAGASALGGTNIASPEELRQTIAVLAYQYAERRNFEPGHEMEDWLNAESEVLAEQVALKGFPA